VLNNNGGFSSKETFMSQKKTVLDLPELLAKLPSPQRQLLRAHREQGRLVVPPPFREKIRRWYGLPGDADSSAALDRASCQEVIRTDNLYTFEGTVFNYLRSRRPLARPATSLLNDAIKMAETDCDFCNPLNMTAEDTWGRCKGEHCLTAANIAKYDVAHGVVIFKNHHPHQFAAPEVADYLDTAKQWLQTTFDRSARRLKYPFLMWNCLGNAAASQPHGHQQISANAVGPYAKETLAEKAAAQFARDFPGRDYWAEWLDAHRSLGLVRDLDNAIHIAASITPLKEKECIIVDSRPGAAPLDGELSRALNLVLRSFIDDLSVLSFNVGFHLPPLDEWNRRQRPLIVRCVDRGDPSPVPPAKLKSADIGGMELYGSTVVASDPFAVIEALNAHPA
jgi:hypothetical protein